MTLLLWIALGMGLSGNAMAGWEYSESAKLRKKTPDSAPAASRDSGSRVQVFGRESPNGVTANDYAELLREDAEANGEPMASSEVDSDESSVNTEFEAVRSRIRTRTVAEKDTDYEPESKPKAVPSSSRPKKVAPRPAEIPPPPPMETEVITPQKAPGKKVYSASSDAAEAPRGDEVNAAFPYTHLLPSPNNIPGGSYVFGTSFAYGLFDFLQVSTNLARTIQQHWNFQAKVPLVEYPTFVASAFVDYESYNPHHIDDTNPDFWLNRWQPGLVTGYEITPDIAFFLGGNFNFGKDAVPVYTTSGYLRGAQMNMEWSWLYNPAKSKLGNNALALGLKYDFTYSLFGFGFTHHWRTFELGVHYTLADRDRFMPIFGFTVGASF